MNKTIKKISCALGIGVIACLPTISQAAQPLNLSLPDSSFKTETINLASSEPNNQTLKIDFKSQADYEEPLFSGNKMHQYLGLTTLALVALTAVLPKEEDGPHETAGTLAAVTAGATVASGLINHWDDFDLSQGISEPDNMHMILGSLGALAMVAAVSQAPEGGHPGLGIAGGVMMGIAIKSTW